jgi:4-amino-4-deoxy-L-arabinose transferase-like glycosyltransferase
MEKLRTPALILALALIVRLVWVFTISIMEAPDEGAHYWVISFIHEHICLPTIADISKDPAAAYYGSLPPLGYLPHLISCFAFPGLETAMAARIGNACVSLVIVYCAYFLGQQLFSKDKILALSLPFLAVFHPQLVFVNAYSNNDSTTCAICSALICLLCVALKQGLNHGLCLSTGVLTSWLLLSKYSGYSLIPALGIGLVMALSLHPINLRTASLLLLELVGVAGICSAWWFIRNEWLFSGDFTGLKTMLQMHDRAYHEPPPLYRFPAINNANWRSTVFMSFWGLFGNMNRLLPRYIYRGYSLLLGLSGISLLASAFLKLKAQHFLVNSLWREIRINRISIAVWLFLGCCCIFSFLGLIAASTSINATGSPQGRYLFPAELAFIAVTIGGFACLRQRWARVAATTFVLFNSFACLLSWGYLFSLYGMRLKIF